MPHTHYRFLQSMIVMGLSLYLVDKMITGEISYYINVRLAYLTFIGALLLALLAGAGLSSLFSASIGDHASSAATVMQGKDRHYWMLLFFLPMIILLLGFSRTMILIVYLLVIVIGLLRLPHPLHPPDEETGSHSAYPPIALVLIAIPLILGFFVPTRPLSTSAIHTRGMNFSAPGSIDQSSKEPAEISSEERNILDWIKIFNYEQDLTPFIGKPADVIGFVYHDSTLPPGHFMVGRFAVTCCIADAFAIGMAVAWPESERLTDDTWVNVKGTITEFDLNGKKIPMIQAQSISPVQTPEQPYLYP